MSPYKKNTGKKPAKKKAGIAKKPAVRKKSTARKPRVAPAPSPELARYQGEQLHNLLNLFIHDRLQDDLDLVLDRIAGYLEKNIGCTGFNVKILDDNGQLLARSLNEGKTVGEIRAGQENTAVWFEAVFDRAGKDGFMARLPVALEKKTFGVIEVVTLPVDDYFDTNCTILRELAAMTAMVVNFILEKRTEARRITQKEAQLSVMHDMGELINSITDMSKLLNIIINMVRDVMNVEICTLMMIDEDTNKLVLTAQGGLSENIEENFTLFTIWEELADYIVKDQNPVLIEDINTDERFKDSFQEEIKVKSFLSVPLKIKGKINGILNANKKKDKQTFAREDLDIFVTFANQVAKAIESAQLYEDLQEVYLSTITSLVSAIEAKDPYTHGHSERVALYSVEIAKHMEPPFDKKELEILNYAAILHDIGKIGIKEQILNKIEPLLDEEFLLIRSHPNIGADIIRPIKFLQSAAAIAQHHHERYDGKGYPDGLKGLDIPLGARIICVADSFDAMTSTRAYRGSLPEEIALKELEDNKGKQFDPAICDVFLRVYPDLKKKGIINLKAV